MSRPIAKAANLEENFWQPTFFYRRARDGFADALVNLLTEANRRVMLPSFIGWSAREGSGVFDPIKTAKAEPVFYRLKNDLTVNPIVFEAAIKEHRPAVAVVIHYFGRTDPELEELGSIASRIGDFSIFSLHKMFPTSSGGMVRYRNATLLRDQQSTIEGMASWLLNYDWNAISLRRRQNFNSVNDRLVKSASLGSDFELMWPTLAAADVPQTLPILFRGVDRDAVYHAMNAEGFGMTSLYHTMIPEVQTRFPEMVSISQNIINFPLHQDMDVSQVGDMVDSFECAIRTYQSA